ncbi:MAG: sulfotransferase [Gammaproteobacteria bacterium]|nr:sulfotransferase [Gammaproteobacteria bacterium]MYK48257.1 sulfotransferase [Gammaproteobacteria bacterium]
MTGGVFPDQGRRPRAIVALNALGRGLRRFGIGDALDADQMVAAARKRTGLEDFGDSYFDSAFRVLVESINEEARLSTVGRLVQRQQIVGLLANRLRVEDLLRRHPEIHELDVGRIILIAGMQRTGTTLMQRLLASNPAVRSLSAWEALNPVPLPGEGRADCHRRVRLAKASERTLAYLAPTLFPIHPIEHDAPEEDILLLDLTFMSQTFEATMHVPSYARWLEQQDQSKTYEYLRTLMKILVWQRPGDVWVLKTPQHLEHLDVVLEVLPKTTIVQTHRDPVIAVASFCSMVAHARGMMSEHVDPGEISAHWIPKVRRALALAMEVRATVPPSRFVDVSYYDLLDDPLTVLRRVYKALRLDFGPAAEAALAAARASNRQHRYGRHAYDAADFGISCRRIEDCFAWYRARFGIPTEPARDGSRS